MAIFDQNYRPPEGEVVDIPHAVARSIIGAIDVFGSGGIELFNQIIMPPLERRRNEWMEDVGAALRKLEAQKGVDLAALPDNPAFIDIAMQTTAAAIRTSKADKREALRNALLNASSGVAPDPSLQHVFVSLIDAFTEWHLRVLKIFAGPEAWFRKHQASHIQKSLNGVLATVLEDAYPELRNRRDFVELVCRDLDAKGLINIATPLASGATLYATSEVPDLFAKRTTDLGDQFLGLIESPVEQ